jgi:recombination associated protein RdgC
MFYKKLSVYQLQESPDKEILNEKFVALPARDCQDLEREHMGFVSPLVGSEEMVHQIEGASFFTIKTSSRVLPPSVVNEVVAKKQREIEKRENRKVGRKEKAELKDEVLVDLLPKAFQKSQDSRGYFDWTRGLLVVNETSANKCDSILSLIRNALGGLKAIPLQDFPDSKLVTSWVSTKTFPEGL